MRNTDAHDPKADPDHASEASLVEPDAEMIFWLDSKTGQVFEAQRWYSQPSVDESQSFFDSYQRAVSAAEALGCPTPSTILTDHDGLAAAFSSDSGSWPTFELQQIGILDELAEAFADPNILIMAQPYHEISGLEDEEIAEFFDATKRLHDAAPWEFFSENPGIALNVPELGITDAVITVIGQGQELRGFALLGSSAALNLIDFEDSDSLDDLDAYWVTYASLEEISPSRHLEFTRTRKNLASEAAYPMAAHMLYGRAENLGRSEIRLLTYLSSALADFTEIATNSENSTGTAPNESPPSEDSPLELERSYDWPGRESFKIQYSYPAKAFDDEWLYEHEYPEALNLAVDVFEVLCDLYDFGSAPPKTFTMDDAVWVISKSIECMVHTTEKTQSSYTLSDFERDLPTLIPRIYSAEHRAAALELLDDVYEQLAIRGKLDREEAVGIAKFVRAGSFKKMLQEGNLPKYVPRPSAS